jgi:hypothetical protein
MAKRTSLVDRRPLPVELIARRICLIRGQRVMLDASLAELYQVPTFRLNEAVKRNIERFPDDFMFQLSGEEAQSLTSQAAMSKPVGRGGRRTVPYAFTEHGVAMLSSILRSDRAVQMNIFIIRAFVKLRELLATHKALAQKVEQLAATQKDHGALFDIVIADINALDRTFTQELRRMKAPPRRKPRIGFYTGAKK